MGQLGGEMVCGKILRIFQVGRDHRLNCGREIKIGTLVASKILHNWRRIPMIVICQKKTIIEKNIDRRGRRKMNMSTFCRAAIVWSETDSVTADPSVTATLQSWGKRMSSAVGTKPQAHGKR